MKKKTNLFCFIICKMYIYLGEIKNDSLSVFIFADTFFFFTDPENTELILRAHFNFAISLSLMKRLPKPPFASLHGLQT